MTHSTALGTIDQVRPLLARVWGSPNHPLEYPLVELYHGLQNLDSTSKSHATPSLSHENPQSSTPTDPAFQFLTAGLTDVFQKLDACLPPSHPNARNSDQRASARVESLVPVLNHYASIIRHFDKALGGSARRQEHVQLNKASISGIVDRFFQGQHPALLSADAGQPCHQLASEDEDIGSSLRRIIKNKASIYLSDPSIRCAWSISHALYWLKSAQSKLAPQGHGQAIPSISNSPLIEPLSLAVDILVDLIKSAWLVVGLDRFEEFDSLPEGVHVFLALLYSELLHTFDRLYSTQAVHLQYDELEEQWTYYCRPTLPWEARPGTQLSTQSGEARSQTFADLRSSHATEKLPISIGSGTNLGLAIDTGLIDREHVAGPSNSTQSAFRNLSLNARSQSPLTIVTESSVGGVAVRRSLSVKSAETGSTGGGVALSSDPAKTSAHGGNIPSSITSIAPSRASDPRRELDDASKRQLKNPLKTLGRLIEPRSPKNKHPSLPKGREMNSSQTYSNAGSIPTSHGSIQHSPTVDEDSHEHTATRVGDVSMTENREPKPSTAHTEKHTRRSVRQRSGRSALARAYNQKSSTVQTNTPPRSPEGRIPWVGSIRRRSAESRDESRTQSQARSRTESRHDSHVTNGPSTLLLEAPLQVVPTSLSDSSSSHTRSSTNPTNSTTSNPDMFAGMILAQQPPSSGLLVRDIEEDRPPSELNFNALSEPYETQIMNSETGEDWYTSLKTSFLEDLQSPHWMPSRIKMFKSQWAYNGLNVRLWVEREGVAPREVRFGIQGTELIPTYAFSSRDSGNGFPCEDIHLRAAGTTLRIQFLFDRSNPEETELYGFQGGLLGSLFEGQYPAQGILFQPKRDASQFWSNTSFQIWTDAPSQLENDDRGASPTLATASALPTGLGQRHHSLDFSNNDVRAVKMFFFMGEAIFVLFVSDRLELQKTYNKKSKARATGTTSIIIRPRSKDSVKYLRVCRLQGSRTALPGIPLDASGLRFDDQDRDDLYHNYEYARIDFETDEECEDFEANFNERVEEWKDRRKALMRIRREQQVAVVQTKGLIVTGDHSLR